MMGLSIFNETLGNHAANVEAARATAMGLDSLGARASEMANILRSDPTQLNAMADRCMLLGQEFSDVFSSASQFKESSERLLEKMTEISQAPCESESSIPNDGGRTQTVHVGNGAAGRMIDFS